MKYQIFATAPDDFAPSLEVSSCFCRYLDKILLLERSSRSSQGGTWGLPAGKFEAEEDARQAVVREIYEETGLEIDDHKLQEIGKQFVRLPHVDYVYHMFTREFVTLPVVKLSDEHTQYRWLTLQEALELPLISGAKDSFAMYLSFRALEGHV